jgi:ZIP family zinc transporter
MELKLLSMLFMGASTVAGTLIGLLAGKIPHRLNDAMLGLAAGIMLAASILGLIEPAFSEPGAAGLGLALLGTVTGTAAVSLLDKFTPHLHRLAGVDTEEHRNNASISRILLFVSAIALHKIPESLAAGIGFGAPETSDALTLAAAISLQNIPEAIVIVAPLLAAGVSKGRTICISFAIAATSIASVAGGMAIAERFHFAMPFLSATAGGAMLYVISDEMIPETHSHGHEKSATFALIAGLVLVVVMQRLLAVLAICSRATP